MYTFEQLWQMNYSKLRLLGFNDLPEKLQADLNEKLVKNKGQFINTGTRIYAVSPEGKRVFEAQRHSDRRTGASVWSVNYSKRKVCLCRDVIGYTFDVRLKRFGATADGTSVPQSLPYKKDVIEFMKHIEWLKSYIENNEKS